VTPLQPHPDSGALLAWRQLREQVTRIEGKVDALSTAVLEIAKALIARGSM